MVSENRPIRFGAVLVLFALALPQPASAEFQLIDDFSSYTLGDLDGQTDGSGEWEAGFSFQVDEDLTDAGNQVMNVTDANGTEDGVLNDDPKLNVANATQATLFYRFYRGHPDTHVNWGLTDLDDPVPASWGGFETQFRDRSAVVDVKIFPPDATFVEIDNVDLLPEEEWINAWVVVDNASDSRELYLQSENAYPEQVKLTSFGDDVFDFQNGTDDALITFWIRNSNPHTGPWYLDDIYLDPGGENLSNPLLGGVAQLQAGDADMDLDFDQLDLVKVQVAAKYLSGQPATWGDGDWDGAPGGQPGSPPAGNGRFDQLDIIAALANGLYLTGPYGSIISGGQAGDNQTSVVYNPDTGELSVDAPNGVELTSINIESASSIFTGDPAGNLGGSFDNDADNNIFKATFGSSFGSLSFGNVAQTGLSEDFVANDLTVVGSLNGGGQLGAVDLVYIPESSTNALAILGLLSVVVAWRRKPRI